MFLLHILYWFFVGLLIYSVVVIPVFTVATSAFVSEGYVCDLFIRRKSFWKIYTELWLGFFNFYHPVFGGRLVVLCVL